MKHLKSLNYCKRMIKSTSAFGNASKGFASNELAQTDKSLKDQVVKLSLMLVSGALLWSSGGVQEVKAQVCGDGGMIIPNPDGPGISCSGGSYGLRPYGSHPYDGYGPPPPVNNTAPPPVIQKPSSYGAVAWSDKGGFYGSAANQKTKPDAINVALKNCNRSDCKITMEYANQCVAVAYGLEKGGTYLWTVTAGLTQSKAERTATTKCSKRAKNCKILLSECSLP